MRTIVDIPEESLKALAVYCQAEGVSRAEAVRRAVDFFQKSFAQQTAAAKEAERQKVLNETFGAWADDPLWKGRDAVEYVRALRAEWDRPEDPD